MSRLIWIYTVSNSVTELQLKHLFATMDVSKFRDGRVHFRNLGVKGLKQTENCFAMLTHPGTVNFSAGFICKYK